MTIYVYVHIEIFLFFIAKVESYSVLFYNRLF